MPHVIVKLWPGREEEQKKDLAKKIVEAMDETMGIKESSVSVSFEEVDRVEWIKKVYEPDIRAKESNLYIKPGYKPEDI